MSFHGIIDCVCKCNGIVSFFQNDVELKKGQNHMQDMQAHRSLLASLASRYIETYTALHAVIQMIK